MRPSGQEPPLLLSWGVAVTYRSDAGEITLGRLIGTGLVIFFVCLLFLFVDVRHRMAGYEAVHGQGVSGTISVTKCESNQLGSHCVGNFLSADGKIQRKDVRVNGVKTAESQVLPAAITDADADEAWTAEGQPWLSFSAIQLAALVPVVMALAMLWAFIAGGPRTWRAQSHAVRSRFERGREAAHEREVRLGRVH
jgi:hypothetical protein